MTRHRRQFTKTDLLDVEINAENTALPMSDPLATLAKSQARWAAELTELCDQIGWERSGIFVERSGGSAEFEKQVLRYRRGRGPQMNIVAGVARLFNDEMLPEVFEQHHGIGWYLVKLLQLAERIESLLRAGNARQAIAAAIEMGQLDCELALKATVEPRWHSGVRSREGGIKGRRAQLGFPGVGDKAEKFSDAYRQHIFEGKSELQARKLAAKFAGIDDSYARRLRKKLPVFEPVKI